jgi:hypothetical protein
MLHFKSLGACADASAKNWRTDFCIHQGRANWREWDKNGKITNDVRSSLLSLQEVTAMTRNNPPPPPPYILSVYTVKAYKGKGGRAPFIPDLCTNWKWVDSFTLRPPCSLEWTPVPIEEEADCAPQTVMTFFWKCEHLFAPGEIQTLDSTTPSQVAVRITWPPASFPYRISARKVEGLWVMRVFFKALSELRLITDQVAWKEIVKERFEQRPTAHT